MQVSADAMERSLLSPSTESRSISRCASAGSLPVPYVLALKESRKGARMESSSFIQRTHSCVSVPMKSCLSTADLCKLDRESTKIKKSVSFHRIEIREHERALGDNPAVTSGPALSIGWGSVNAITVNVEEYEEFRPPRRTRSELQMPATIRRQLLAEHVDVNRSEINAASRETERIKQSRLRNQKSRDLQPLVMLSDMLRGKDKKTKKMARVLLEQGQRADEARRKQQQEVNRMHKLQKEIEEACYHHQEQKLKEFRDRELKICMDQIRIEQNSRKVDSSCSPMNGIKKHEKVFHQLELQSSFLPDAKLSNEDEWEF